MYTVYIYRYTVYINIHISLYDVMCIYIYIITSICRGIVCYSMLFYVLYSITYYTDCMVF